MARIYEKDSAHMDILVEAMKYASRLGRPVSPIAFVFSYSGTRHAEPYTYETVFQFYWALVKHLLYKAHMPILTFFADTLEEDLARHPEVQVLVFEEHFPLTVEQMSVIRNWWQGTTRRAVIAFGSGLGYSSDISSPGLQPCVQSFPGVLDLIGLRQESKPQLSFKNEVQIKDTARIRRSAFLGDELTLKINAVANVRRIFGARANVLYEVDTSDGPVALVAEWRDRNTLAMFCGFGLNDNTVEAAEKAIRYALHEVDCPKSIVDKCDDGILWNINANGYLVFSNISDAIANVKIKPVRTNLWDCAAQSLLPCDLESIDVEPHSFRVFRVVGKRSKFLDILGASYLRRLTDGAGRAELELIAGRKTILVLKSPPKEILVDGKPSAIEYEIINNNYHVIINQCQPGERVIELRW